MNTTELNFFSTYKPALSSTVDPFSIADGLYHTGHFTARQRTNIYKISNECPDRSNTWNTLFVLIPTKCSLRQFTEVLFQSGYSNLALEISHRWRMACTYSMQLIQRTNCDSGQRFAQKLFMNFKINTHNNVFANPRQYCHDQATKYSFQLANLQAGNNMKQRIADRLTACLLGEIDSYIMLYERRFPADHLFNNLKRMITETSNSNVTELSYFSSLAISCAVSGNHEEGEEYIQKALMLSLLIGRCVEIANLLYIYVFLLLCIHERNPSNVSRDKVLSVSEMGLQSVEDEEDSVREFWLRIFYLRMIYCLLGLSFRGDPIRGVSVSKNSITRAKQLMAEVDKLWERMETRRKIMYYVAKARIFELERMPGYRETVLFFLNKAIDIGNEGKYGETQYIKLYNESVGYGTHMCEQDDVCKDKRHHVTDSEQSSETRTTSSSEHVSSSSDNSVSNEHDTAENGITSSSSITGHLNRLAPSLYSRTEHLNPLSMETSIESNYVRFAIFSSDSESEVISGYDRIQSNIPSLAFSTSDSNCFESHTTISIDVNDSHGNPRREFTDLNNPIIRLHNKE